MRCLAPAAAGLCSFALILVIGPSLARAEIASLDRFNDEDIAEFGEEPVKYQDRGLLLDKLFNQIRMMPGNGIGRIGQSDRRYDGYLNSNSGFNVVAGNRPIYGLNYGSNNNWGSGMASYGGMGMFGYGDVPRAGPPVFVVPAPPDSQSKSGTTAAPDGASTTPNPNGTAAGTTTMRPDVKADALVRAFGGGEKPRIEQMGPPILVPLGSVPGMGKLPMGRKKVLRPGEQESMYGKIMLGPPKFAQLTDANSNKGDGFRSAGTSPLTLVRYHKGARENANAGLGQVDARSRFGYRSIEPYQPSQTFVRKAPPVIKYVPVIETVVRRTMKASLVDPE